MRCLERNKSTVYYANFLGLDKVYEDNLFTGEYEPSYDEMVELKANVSPANGSVYENPFGLAEGYDKIIVYDDPNLDINEQTVFWIDNLDSQYLPPFDYVVFRIARSLNSISIAVKKVDVYVNTNTM